MHLGADADSRDDGARRRFDGFRLLDNVFEGGIKVCLALGDEAGGMGVAIDCGVMGKAEFAHDAAGGAPADVGVIDVFPVCAAADTALAAVAGGWFLFF